MHDRRWFVMLDNGRQLGPLTTDEVAIGLLEERFRTRAMVRSVNGESWREAGGIEEFRTTVRAARGYPRRTLSSRPPAPMAEDDAASTGFYAPMMGRVPMMEDDAAGTALYASLGSRIPIPMAEDDAAGTALYASLGSRIPIPMAEDDAAGTALYASLGSRIPIPMAEDDAVGVALYAPVGSRVPIPMAEDDAAGTALYASLGSRIPVPLVDDDAAETELYLSVLEEDPPAPEPDAPLPYDPDDDTRTGFADPAALESCRPKAPESIPASDRKLSAATLRSAPPPSIPRSAPPPSARTSGSTSVHGDAGNRAEAAVSQPTESRRPPSDRAGAGVDEHKVIETTSAARRPVAVGAWSPGAKIAAAAVAFVVAVAVSTTMAWFILHP